jgi:hypothetical protein
VSASPDPAGAPLERAALVFAHAAPYAGILAAFYRPFQAVFLHRAAPAHLFGLVDLEKGGTCITDGEEQLRIHVTAGGVVAPVHAVHSFVAGEPRLTARSSWPVSQAYRPFLVADEPGARRP